MELCPRSQHPWASLKDWPGLLSPPLNTGVSHGHSELLLVAGQHRKSMAGSTGGLGLALAIKRDPILCTTSLSQFVSMECVGS